jgi:hypothetical protein
MNTCCCEFSGAKKKDRENFNLSVCHIQTPSSRDIMKTFLQTDEKRNIKKNVQKKKKKKRK